MDSGDEFKNLSVGLIGAGRIGLPIATRISGAGFKTVVFDVAEERLAEARASGLSTVGDTAGLADADIMIIIVAKTAQVIEVFGREPFVSGRMSGKPVVVVSTVGPEAIRRLEPLATRLGVILVDCPVTGGVDRAEKGELTLFLACVANAVEKLRPVLAPVGTVVICGEKPGDGQAFKMVNNMLAVTHLSAAAEALALALRLGLDSNQLLEVLPRGTAASWMLSDRGQRLVGPPEDRVEASIYLEILAKDANLVVETAESVGLSTPVAEAARQQWHLAVEMGLGYHDDTAIIETYLSRGIEPADSEAGAHSAAGVLAR